MYHVRVSYALLAMRQSGSRLVSTLAVNFAVCRVIKQATGWRLILLFEVFIQCLFAHDRAEYVEVEHILLKVAWLNAGVDKALIVINDFAFSTKLNFAACYRAGIRATMKKNVTKVGAVSVGGVFYNGILATLYPGDLGFGLVMKYGVYAFSCVLFLKVEDFGAMWMLFNQKSAGCMLWRW